jgi:beta-galactosidase
LTTNPVAKPEGNFPVTNISYAQPDLNDSQWRLLNLPHDWGIEGPFKQEYPGETGKLPWWGVAWYRKHLDVPASDNGKKIYLSIDGAMSYATVWLNGQFVGGWPYGYASWQVDLTPFVKFGGENVIAIRLDNPKESSRWYPGGGIYRNVWLEKTAPVHVAHWGTLVTTPAVSDKEATVKIQVQLQNDSSNEASLKVNNKLVELKADGSTGEEIAAVSMEGVNLPAQHSESRTSAITFGKPKLWTLKKPQRYAVITSI